MRSISTQIFEDEMLMEFADGTLPEHQVVHVSATLERSDADRKTLKIFEASAILIEFLRMHANGVDEKSKVDGPVSQG